jgi:hypothetical protein
MIDKVYTSFLAIYAISKKYMNFRGWGGGWGKIHKKISNALPLFGVPVKR